MNQTVMRAQSMNFDTYLNNADIKIPNTDQMRWFNLIDDAISRFYTKPKPDKSDSQLGSASYKLPLLDADKVQKAIARVLEYDKKTWAEKFWGFFSGESRDVNQLRRTLIMTQLLEARLECSRWSRAIESIRGDRAGSHLSHASSAFTQSAMDKAYSRCETRHSMGDGDAKCGLAKTVRSFKAESIYHPRRHLDFGYSKTDRHFKTRYQSHLARIISVDSEDEGVPIRDGFSVRGWSFSQQVAKLSIFDAFGWMARSCVNFLQGKSSQEVAATSMIEVSVSSYADAVKAAYDRDFTTAVEPAVSGSVHNSVVDIAPLNYKDAGETRTKAIKADTKAFEAETREERTKRLAAESGTRQAERQVGRLATSFADADRELRDTPNVEISCSAPGA